MAGTRRTVRTAWAAGLLVAVVSLSSCAGSGGGSDSSAGGSSDMAPATGREAAGGSATSAVDRAPVRTAAVIKTAEVYVTSDHLDRVRAQAVRLVTAVDGTVDGEQTADDRHGHVRTATLTLRVPVDAFAATKSSLEHLGRLRHSDAHQEDVTTEVIDVHERVQTLQNSLDRLQRFQRQAQDVTDLLKFEDEIAQRQAELQSLQAQQSYLEDQTSMSTITLHLSRPGSAPDALAGAGFWAGLRSGWHALGDVLVVVLTVLGAVLPFALLAALVGLPVWWLARLAARRRRTAVVVPADEG
jgi:hypothetical protein